MPAVAGIERRRRRRRQRGSGRRTEREIEGEVREMDGLGGFFLFFSLGGWMDVGWRDGWMDVRHVINPRHKCFHQ
jgi:hypothetical protein